MLFRLVTPVFQTKVR